MTTRALAAALGREVPGSTIDSPLEWVEALKHRLPTAALDAAVESGILTREETDEFMEVYAYLDVASILPATPETCYLQGSCSVPEAAVPPTSGPAC